MIEIPSEIVTEEQLQRFEKRRNRRKGAYGGSTKSSALHETLINLATARHDLIVDAEPCQSCNISAAELIQLENELVADGFPSLGIRESLGFPKDFDPTKLPPPASPGTGGYQQVPPSTGSTNAPSGKTISVGDSFAEQHQIDNKSTIRAGVRSRSPEMVLDAIKAIPKSDIAGSEVFLSTGTANRLGMTSKENIIRQQLEYLTSAGPCMILVSGIGTAQQDKPADSKKSNDMVAKLVNEFKAKFPNIRFLGEIPMNRIKSDKIHPVAGWYTKEAGFTGCSKK